MKLSLYKLSLVPRQHVSSPYSTQWSYHATTCDDHSNFFLSSMHVPKMPSVIQKVLIKSISKVGNSGSKMFTLRSIDSVKVASRDTLKAEI